MKYSNLDPKTLKLIEDVQSRTPAALQLAELKKMSEAMTKVVAALDSQLTRGVTDKGDIAELLFEIRDGIDTIGNYEAPESPDYAKPVVEAVSKLEKALSASIKGIDVKPAVVPAPNVRVDAPTIDLKGIEQVLKSDLPKAFNEAIAKIPESLEIDYTDLFQEMLSKLGDIDTGTRMKPLPPSSMKVQNMDGTAISGAVKTKRFDINGSTIYLAKADPGIAEGDPAWLITKFDFTDGPNSYGKIAINAVWTNRASTSYV